MLLAVETIEVAEETENTPEFEEETEDYVGMLLATRSVLKSHDAEETVRGGCKGQIINISDTSSEKHRQNFLTTSKEAPSQNYRIAATDTRQVRSLG